MEGQFLITQLAVLLKQRAAQHRFRRQTRATGFLDPMPAQVPRYQVQQIAMIVQPLRHRAELTADLVFGEKIKYTCLDGAFLAHCRLRRLRVCL